MVTLWDEAQLIKINAYKKKAGNFNIGIDKEIPEKKRLLGHKYKDISPRCSLGACARKARRECAATLYCAKICKLLRPTCFS